MTLDRRRRTERKNETVDKNDPVHTKPSAQLKRYDNIRLRDDHVVLTFSGPHGGLSSVRLDRADMPRLIEDYENIVAAGDGQQRTTRLHDAHARVAERNPWISDGRLDTLEAKGLGEYRTQPGRSIETPSLRQRWLGAKLAELRVQAGFASMTETASVIGRSPASLSRIENGAVAIRPRDVSPILDAYRVENVEVRDRLMVVAAEIQQERRGWWCEYSDLLPPSHIDLIRLEATARAIQTYEMQLIPDLLQTEAYARAAALAHWDLAPGQLERFVDVQMRRQKGLAGEDPLTLRVVLDEAALRTSLGGVEIFRDQLAHLRECAARPNVTLQVVPSTTGAHRGKASAFSILRLPTLDAVHITLLNSDIYAADDGSVQRYLTVFDTIAALALDPAESNTSIEEAQALAEHQAAERAGAATSSLGRRTR